MLFLGTLVILVLNTLYKNNHAYHNISTQPILISESKSFSSSSDQTIDHDTGNVVGLAGAGATTIGLSLPLQQLSHRLGTAGHGLLQKAAPADEAALRADLPQSTLTLYYVAVFVLNVLSALFSGLVLGLLSLDITELEVLKKCGTETERRHATAIIPMRRHSNLLLSSLVIGNVIVNYGLQEVLDTLFPGPIGFVTTTVCVTIFGEILPQAVCARYGLAIGAHTLCITGLVIILTFPVSYPLSKILDWTLGDEIAFVFDRERLQEYIRITKNYNNLDAQEINIITGALKIKKCTVSHVMTKLKDVFMLDIESMINYKTITSIVKRGFSRIPVYKENRRNLIGLLMVKDLALVNPHTEMTLKSLIAFYKHPIMAVDEFHTLDIVLNNFREGKSHMAFVRDHKRREIIGIVTLEDIIEEVLQVEIYDETDIVTDNRELRLRPDAQIPMNLEAFHADRHKRAKTPSPGKNSHSNTPPKPPSTPPKKENSVSKEVKKTGNGNDSALFRVP